jgi:O-antigen/teichoic acid export membrane protein
MSYFSLPIINLFYSTKYALSAPVMSIYVIAEGFLTVFYVLTFILNGAGKVKVPMYVAILGLFLNTFVTYFLIKAYGRLGAAGGTAFMSGVVMIFGLVYTYREFGYLLPAKSFFKIFLVSLVMLAAAFLFPRDSYLFILWSTILFVFYLAILYLLKEIKKDDIDVIRQLVSRKKPAEIEEEFSGNEPSA